MVKKTFIYIVVTFLAFNFSSCEKDLETVDYRDDLVGTWNVVENIADNPLTVNLRKMNDAYQVSISKSIVYQSDIQIKNFFQLGQDFAVRAEIDDDNIQIPTSTINDVTIKGEGTISKNHKQIEWSYWIDMGDGEEFEYKAVYTIEK